MPMLASSWSKQRRRRGIGAVRSRRRRLGRMLDLQAGANGDTSDRFVAFAHRWSSLSSALDSTGRLEAYALRLAMRLVTRFHHLLWYDAPASD